MEIGKRVPGIEPALCRLRDLRLYRSLHEEVSNLSILLKSKELSLKSTYIYYFSALALVFARIWARCEK